MVGGGMGTVSKSILEALKNQNIEGKPPTKRGVPKYFWIIFVKILIQELPAYEMKEVKFGLCQANI